MSKRGKLRILLDTSFILPTLGIDVGESAILGLKKLKEIDCEICVSRFSILESLWVVLKLLKEGKFDEGIFTSGLKSIFESGMYIFVEESENVYKRALNYYLLGHKDMIDNILYAISVEENILFLTLDEELKMFVVENELPNTVITPKSLGKIIK